MPEQRGLAKEAQCGEVIIYIIIFTIGGILITGATSTESTIIITITRTGDTIGGTGTGESPSQYRCSFYEADRAGNERVWHAIYQVDGRRGEAMFSLDMSGLDAFKERLAYARQQLPDLMQKTVRQAGEWVSEELSNGAPIGAAEGPPPSGDAPGKLNASFYVQDEGPNSITVRTSQPQKLEYVTQGTGIYGPRGEPIRPLTKKALYWEGADHPVQSVRGQEANDFVSPALEEAPTAEDVLGEVVDTLIGILEG